MENAIKIVESNLHYYMTYMFNFFKKAKFRTKSTEYYLINENRNYKITIHFADKKSIIIEIACDLYPCT